MPTTRRKYTKEFKQEAVRLVREGGVTTAQTSRDLGISDKILQRWKSELGALGEKAFPGNGLPIEAELAFLRRENEKLRREREILKKATIFFAQHYPEEEAEGQS